MSIKLTEEKGEFLLSHYGNVFALGFRGDAGFLERAHNLAFNYSMTNGAIMSLGDNFRYIITNPERILKALECYFYNEVIRERLVAVSFSENDIIIDEDRTMDLARQSAQDFFDQRIKKENFMFNTYLDRVSERAADFVEN